MQRKSVHRSLRQLLDCTNISEAQFAVWVTSLSKSMGQSSASESTFAIRKRTIKSSPSRKSSRLCCTRIELILMRLIHGDSSVTSFAGSNDLLPGYPQARLPRQGLHSDACWRRLIEC